MNKELYIFSGLGADERVFQLLDFSGFSTTFIKWTPPIENETIENYAKRLLNQIKSTKQTLIGLSLGGIIAIEVAKIIDTEKVMIYLYKVLTKDNFKCFPVTETTLFIYWEYTEEEYTEKPKKQEEEYRQPEIDSNFINSILASKKA